MALGFVSYEVDQDGRFEVYLDKVTKSVSNLRFSMGEAARIIKKGSTANFILKGPGKYPPLNEIYSGRKQILAPGASILVGAKKGSVKGAELVSGGGISGKLRDSIIKTTSNSIINIGKTSLVFGTSAKSSKGAPYPVFVQEGTSKMRPRKFLFLTKRMVTQIINTINSEIGKKWENPKV